MKRLILSTALITLLLGLSGCEEGPFGNTPPQGRPDWMRDKNKDETKP